MRAIEISQPGPPDVLKLCERPMPQPKAGEVLIKVHAAGVNRPDVLQRSGNYPVPPGASDLPGLEIAGEIVGGDLGNSGLRLGDMVCALVQGGGYAEYCTAPAPLCLPIPAGLTPLQAASLPETFFTVWSNVFERGALAAGETLLVQGGTSGIGVSAIQLAAAFGHRVFATAGSGQGRDRRQGRRRHPRHGGRRLCAREIACLADDGRLVFIALLGGGKATVSLGQILLRRLTVTGSTLRSRPVAFKAAIAAQLRERVWPLIGSGAIKPVIYKTYPLAQAAQAHALMEAGAHVGKIVLEVN